MHSFIYRKPGIARINNKVATKNTETITDTIQHQLALLLDPFKAQAGSFNE